MFAPISSRHSLTFTTLTEQLVNPTRAIKFCDRLERRAARFHADLSTPMPVWDASLLGFRILDTVHGVPATPRSQPRFRHQVCR
jgi:hypothetical protein